MVMTMQRRKQIAAEYALRMPELEERIKNNVSRKVQFGLFQEKIAKHGYNISFDALKLMLEWNNENLSWNELLDLFEVAGLEEETKIVMEDNKIIFSNEFDSGEIFLLSENILAVSGKKAARCVNAEDLTILYEYADGVEIQFEIMGNNQPRYFVTNGTKQVGFVIDSMQEFENFVVYRSENFEDEFVKAKTESQRCTTIKKFFPELTAFSTETKSRKNKEKYKYVDGKIISYSINEIIFDFNEDEEEIKINKNNICSNFSENDTVQILEGYAQKIKEVIASKNK